MVDSDLPESCSMSSSRGSKEDISLSTPVNNQKGASESLAEVVKETVIKKRVLS
jgi:hypothetical protein